MLRKRPIKEAPQMTVIPDTRTFTDEVVSEPVAANIDIGVSAAPDVIANQDPGRCSSAVQLRPTPLGNGAISTVVATGPLVRISPLDLQSPRHYPPRLDFLEPNETDRAMDPGSWLVGAKSARPIRSPLANMSTRRLRILAAGLLLLMTGLFALWLPVRLGDFDQWGFRIHCGTGLHGAFSQAEVADSTGTHFVDRCGTAIAVRRAWTIPLAVTGALFLSALVISPLRGRSVNVQTADAGPPRQASRIAQDKTRPALIGVGK
jgi:hypothetical protein